MSFAHRHVLVAIVVCACASACQTDVATMQAPAFGSAGSAGVVAPSAAMAGAGAAGSIAAPLAGETAGAASQGQLAGAGGSAGMMTTAGQGGGAGMHGHDTTMDHCTAGFPPDARDAQITSAPDQWRASNGQIDLVLPTAVLAWMDERVWKQSHDAWHNVRRCTSFFPGVGGSNICMQHPELVAEHQECSDAEDGYQFLVMHRHMMLGLRQAFPQHAQLFEGFPSFPFEAQDVPEAWRGRFGTGWSSQVQETARTLEDIENQLTRFPTEGDLGRFIQCGGMGASAMSSIHGAMHFKWVVMQSPNSLGIQAVNIGNYMFWKLHGWIDQVWERYRVAKGLRPDEPKLVQALAEQCREMHALGLVFDPSIPGDPVMPPVEYGLFHETVRPILEEACASCHGGSTPMAGLPLGGKISSSMIVQQLVGVAAQQGGQFMRVVAGDPQRSWLYLKVSDTAKSAGCTGRCNTQGMPPTGRVELTGAQLTAIRDWILAGAPAPTASP